MSYAILNIEVKNASMLQAHSILSPAPVMPAMMFAHALDFRLGKKLGVNGVGLIHKSCSPRIEYMQNESGFTEKLVAFRRGGCMFGKDVASGGSGPKENAMQPEALCDYSWAILLSCSAIASSEMSENIGKELESMRFAGGTISSFKVAMTEDVEKAKRLLSSGFWIDDATDLLSTSSSPLEDLLAIAKKGDGSGWILPANLGYALLEPPEARRGARNEKPHAFAEAMIGLVRLTPVRAALSDENIAQRLWRHGWSKDQFLVTNQHNQQLSEQLSF